MSQEMMCVVVALEAVIEGKPPPKNALEALAKLKLKYRAGVSQLYTKPKED